MAGNGIHMSSLLPAIRRERYHETMNSNPFLDDGEHRSRHARHAYHKHAHDSNIGDTTNTDVSSDIDNTGYIPQVSMVHHDEEPVIQYEVGESHGKRNAITVIFIVLSLLFGAFSGYAVTKTWVAMNPTVKIVTKTVKQSFPSDNDDMRSLVAELRRQDSSLNDVTISAIAGNAWGESKAAPDALEHSDSTPSSTAGDQDIQTWAQAGHGIGIMQWTGDRATKLMQYASSQRSSWKSLSVQVSFLITEMNNTDNWRTPLDDSGKVSADGAAGKSVFEGASDVRTASNAFLLGFVRPANPSDSRDTRLAAALSMYTYMQMNNE